MISNFDDELVAKIVLREFGEREFDIIMGLLAMYAHADPNRVKLAILKLAQGNAIKVRYFTEIACKDFRDVVGPAEYPKQYEMLMSGNLRCEQFPEDRRQYENWLAGE